MAITLYRRQSISGRYNNVTVTALQDDHVDTYDVFAFQTFTRKPEMLTWEGKQHKIRLSPFPAKGGAVDFLDKIIKAIQFVNYDKECNIECEGCGLFVRLSPLTSRTFLFPSGYTVRQWDFVSGRFIGQGYARPATKKFKFGITVVADNP